MVPKVRLLPQAKQMLSYCNFSMHLYVNPQWLLSISLIAWKSVSLYWPLVIPLVKISSRAVMHTRLSGPRRDVEIVCLAAQLLLQISCDVLRPPCNRLPCEGQILKKYLSSMDGVLPQSRPGTLINSPSENGFRLLAIL